MSELDRLREELRNVKMRQVALDMQDHIRSLEEQQFASWVQGRRMNLERQIAAMEKDKKNEQ